MDNLNDLTERELLIWAAGLFEGEGCFSSRTDGRTDKKYFTMNLGMTDEDVVRQFHTVMRVGTVRIKHAPSMKVDNRQPIFMWQITGKEAIDTALRLFPYLGKRRREKLTDLVIEHHSRQIRETIEVVKYVG